MQSLGDGFHILALSGLESSQGKSLECAHNLVLLTDSANEKMWHGPGARDSSSPPGFSFTVRHCRLSLLTGKPRWWQRVCDRNTLCHTVIGRILFNQDIPYSPNIGNLLQGQDRKINH